MRRHAIRSSKLVAAALVMPLGLLFLGGGAANAANSHHHSHHSNDSASTPTFTVHTILSGSTLTHTFTPTGGSATTAALTNPDDITRLGNHIFVGFQNGVGPQGQASTSGNPDSTVVEMRLDGDPIAQWDLQGKTDGVTADPKTGDVIATVNEDLNSRLYTIDPSTDTLTHYTYSSALAHNGGTDAISIYHGQIMISASAPGTLGASAPDGSYPAVYVVSLNGTTHVATDTPLFNDEDMATVANVDASNHGESTQLMLTDPDSNEVVPDGARFGGDFMLTSQGDLEQIYVHDAGGRNQHLSVLSLTQPVDDTAWPTEHGGRLYSTDSANDTVDLITGPFKANHPMVVAMPCGANTAPAICPGSGVGPNDLASLNEYTGAVTAVNTIGATYTPEGGLIYVPGSEDFGHHGYGNGKATIAARTTTTDPATTATADATTTETTSQLASP